MARRLLVIYGENGEIKKECSVCRKIKDINDFSKDRNKKLGYDIICLECMRKRNRYLYSKNPSAFYNSSRLWIKNNTEKQRAHAALNKAVLKGRIIKPKNCEKCGASGKLDGHHWHGYDNNHIFDVQWLCRKCHKEEEKLLV